MAPFLSENQQCLLSVLAETRWLRRDQALRLLRQKEPWKTQEQTDTALRQLMHLSRIVAVGDNSVALRDCWRQAPDLVMLDAVDVMLDLVGEELLTLSAHRPPFKLCFLTNLKDGRIASFAILPLEPGREQQQVRTAADAPGDHRSFIFLLSSMAQATKVKTAFPHYLALRENGRFRYFKGGDGSMVE